jgi:hypothetical protein
MGQRPVSRAFLFLCSATCIHLINLGKCYFVVLSNLAVITWRERERKKKESGVRNHFSSEGQISWQLHKWYNALWRATSLLTEAWQNPFISSFVKTDAVLGLWALNVNCSRYPLLRPIPFYFHFYTYVFLSVFLPSCFAHSWLIYFCHFNSSSWSSAIISEFYGSLPRYSGGVLLILLQAHGSFTKTSG